MNISFFFRILLTFLLITGFWVGSIQAQETEAPSEDALKIENSLFWEISGKGLKKPSYLFGTIHLIPKDSFFIPKVMEAPLDEVDHLVLEMELDMSAMFSSMFGMMMPPDKPLKSLLSEEDYTFLKSYVEDSLPEGGMPMPMMMVEMIKPIFTAQMLASLACEGEAQDQMSYEIYLDELFDKSDRPVSGLETAKDQLAALDKIPLEDQADQLMEAVRNPESMCGDFGEMVAIYRRQDLSSLMTLTESDPGLGNHLEDLLDKRNKKWIPQIEEMSQNESLLIAVGAGHLAGPNGVINLLRKAGFTLKPLKDTELE